MGSPQSSLQLRVASVFLLLALAFSVGSYVALQWMVFPVFAQLEQDEARADLTRVKLLLETELEAIAAIGRRYSQSTEAWNFLKGNANNYPQSSIHTSTWHDIDIELMLFFESSGDLAWGKVVDPKKGEIISVHEQAERPASRGRTFIRRKRTLTEVTGIVEGERGLLLTALQPVYKTDGSGDPAGFFLIGRFLTPARRDEFSERIGVDFSLIPVVEQSGTVDGLAPGSSTNYFPSQPVEYSYFSESVVSSQRLRDAFDHYTLRLEAHTPRMITHMGNGIERLSFAFLTIMSSLFVLLTWLSIRWLVVDPIRLLKNHMATIRSTGDLALSLDLGRHDEVGELAEEFGFMQRALGDAHLKLEQARDEALLMAKRKSEFLAGMSHEIRTPMNGVVGMTELLLKTDLNQPQQHLVETIQSSSSALVNVVNDILDFSQIGTGKIYLSERAFTISELIREVNAVVTEPAHRKGLEYITIEDKRVPGGIVADDRRVRQVLINLLGNAIKFTREGQVVLRVDCEKTWWEKEVEKALVKFTVTDTGIGISDAMRDQVFSTSGQIDSSSTREYPGTGLGLPISKHLVELMGGEIGFDSEEGSGSEFWFTLPVELKRSLAIPQSPIENDETLRGKRILIVDDSVTNCRALLDQSSGWGAVTDMAHSASQALARLDTAAAAKEYFDVLIIDYQMPGTNGLELAEAVAANENYRRPVVIILSSLTEPLTEEDLAARNISCYLPKPIMGEDLFLQVSRALSAKSSFSGSGQFLEARTGQQVSNVKLDVEVLVAEDNQVNQQLIEMVLEDFGCRCVLVENGREALARLAENTFDLIIMDCQMPVMDGFEATRKIRKDNVPSTAGERIPILALTANAMDGDRQRCLDAGMDSYIAKPFSSEDLADAIEQLVPRLAEFPEKAEHNELPRLDSESLDRVRQMQREGKPDILTRLIDVYLDTSPELVRQLDAAVKAGDLAALELSAHTLKSSSANLGALDFSQLCAEVEQAAREGVTDNLEVQCEHVLADFEDVCVALRREQKNDE